MRKEVEIWQQARIVRATGGAVCPVRDQVQEHNHDLKGEEKFSAASRLTAHWRLSSSRR
jgi:hypothetical protein